MRCCLGSGREISTNFPCDAAWILGAKSIPTFRRIFQISLAGSLAHAALPRGKNWQTSLPRIWAAPLPLPRAHGFLIQLLNMLANALTVAGRSATRAMSHAAAQRISRPRPPQAVADRSWGKVTQHPCSTSLWSMRKNRCKQCSASAAPMQTRSTLVTPDQTEHILALRCQVDGQRHA